MGLVWKFTYARSWFSHLDVDPWRVCWWRAVRSKASNDLREAAVRVSLHEQDETSQWHKHARRNSDGLENCTPSAPLWMVETPIWGRYHKRIAAREHRTLRLINNTERYPVTHRPLVTRWRIPGCHPHLWSHTPHHALRSASLWQLHWRFRSCPGRRGHGSAGHDLMLSGPHASDVQGYGGAWSQKGPGRIHQGIEWG